MPPEETVLDRLDRAIEEGDGACFKTLLAEASTHEEWSESYVLCRAAEFGRLELIRLLLDDGANVEGDAEGGAFPLAIAVAEGHADVVTVLLGAGADPNRVGWIEGQGGEEATPLALAAEGDSFEITRLLLRAGADPNCSVSADEVENSALPLHHAASPEMVDLLVEHGAKLDTEVPAVESALGNRRWEVAKHLRKLGSEPTQEGLRETLIGACHDGEREAVQKLLAWGAPVPSDVQAWWSEKVLALLRSAGADD